MKFNIEDYQDPNHAMHCPTEESARFFIGYLRQLGRTWKMGIPYNPEKTYYETHQEDTVYAFNRGCYGPAHSPYVHYKVLEFYDFDWGIQPPYEESDITLNEILGLEEKI